MNVFAFCRNAMGPPRRHRSFSLHDCAQSQLKIVGLVLQGGLPTSVTSLSLNEPYRLSSVSSAALEIHWIINSRYSSPIKASRTQMVLRTGHDGQTPCRFQRLHRLFYDHSSSARSLRSSPRV